MFSWFTALGCHRQCNSYNNALITVEVSTIAKCKYSDDEVMMCETMMWSTTPAG